MQKFNISWQTLFIALQIALTSFFSYVLGFYATSTTHVESARIGGLWAMISGVIVLQATRRETMASASLRILGTAIGSVISAIYLLLFPFNAVSIGICVFIVVFVCHFVRIPDHARLAALTAGIVMVTASLNPSISSNVNAALRFSEACIGTAVAMFAILIWGKNYESAD
ncbi:MAG: FUSC family protein [Gloeomargarita sp. DG02_3_bins_56]